MRYPSAELSVLLGMAEEVDDFRQLLLRLLDPRDVGERDAIPGGLIATGARAAEAAERVLHAPGAPHQPEEQSNEENRRAEPE